MDIQEKMYEQLQKMNTTLIGRDSKMDALEISVSEIKDSQNEFARKFTLFQENREESCPTQRKLDRASAKGEARFNRGTVLVALLITIAVGLPAWIELFGG